MYVGRERGEAARARFPMDDWDRGDAPVTVTIPDSTFSINSSFFLGLFGPSIQAAGSRERFLRKYHFECDVRFWEETIERGIERALFERGLLLGQ